jgi:hypothetical protein
VRPSSSQQVSVTLRPADCRLPIANCRLTCTLIAAVRIHRQHCSQSHLVTSSAEACMIIGGIRVRCAKHSTTPKATTSPCWRRCITL